MLELAGDRPLAAELTFDEFSDDQLIAVKQRLGLTLPILPRLLATFWGSTQEADAAAFGRSLRGQPVTVAGNAVLADRVERPKRLAVLAYRHHAYVVALRGHEVKLTGSVWCEAPPRTKGKKTSARAVDCEALRTLLAARSDVTDLDVKPASYGHGAHIGLRTADPSAILNTVARHAEAIGARLHVGVNELDPLAWAVRRVLADLD